MRRPAIRQELRGPETSATTRAGSGHHLPPAERLLYNGQIVLSVESGLSYRIGRLLGIGGFGQVFLAIRQGTSDTVPETVCIKVSTRQDGWLREAYFGQLLQDHPRAVRVYDAFPLADDRRLLLCRRGAALDGADARKDFSDMNRLAHHIVDAGGEEIERLFERVHFVHCDHWSA